LRLSREASSGVVRAALLLSIVAAAGLVAPRSASAEAACWRTVIQDWSDGSISGVYPVECYRQALQRMPEDVRLYSSASADIGRALTKSIRSTRRAAGVSAAGPVSRSAAVARADDAGGLTSAPLVLGASLAALLAVLAAGGLVAGRRVRPKRPRRRFRPRRLTH
jgi:hypothetical protein